MTQNSELITSQLIQAGLNKKQWGSIGYNAIVENVIEGGVTDTTASLQALVNKAISEGRRTIFLPHITNGQYFVTALTNADQVDFVGDNSSFVGGYTGTIGDLGGFAELQAEQAKQMIYMSNYAAGDGTNETTAIQQAINASIGKILIWTKQDGTHYETRQLVIPSNVHIIFAPGTLVKAAPGYTESERMFRVDGSDNIMIEGNYATLQMLKSEYTTGEQRHIFYLQGNENVTIKNLITKDSGGDSFLISGQQAVGLEKTSKNINILGCVMDNNRRQGVSIVGLVDGCVIDGNTIKNTIGTAPQSAIDIEPNGAAFDNRNITIVNNTLIDNVAGILVHNNSYDVTIKDNKLYNSAEISIRRMAVGDANPTVKIHGNLMKNSLTGGIYVSSCSGIQIYDNEIDTVAGKGIYIQSLIASSTHDNTVRNNTIKAAAGNGINLEGCSNSLVEDNLLIDIEKTAITINNSSHNTEVIKNKFVNCTTSLTGETVIKLGASNTCKVLGNRIRKGTRIPLYAIYVQSTCAETLIEDNDMFDSAAGDLLTDSTTTIIKVNRWLDGSISPYRSTTIPTMNKGWLGASYIRVTAAANDRLYFCIKDSTGAFVLKEVTFL